MRKLIMMLAVLIVTAMSFADTETIDGVMWSFTTSGGNATVTGATPCVGEMIIPVTLGGCPVRSIKDNAFNSCSSLSRIEMPDSITSIGSCAFGYCNNLESVKLSSQLMSIPDKAFTSCRTLKKIVLPPSVKSIGYQGFYACVSLSQLYLPEGIESIGKDAFSFCKSLVTLSIPSSISSIGNSAFAGCASLKLIEIGAGNMCARVVDGCLVSFDNIMLYAAPAGNEYVVIPEGVISLPEGMFKEAPSLKHIKLPTTLTTIGNHAFYNCTSLEAIEFPASLREFTGIYTFYNCNALKRVVFHGAPPFGLNDSGNFSYLNRGVLSYSREYGAEWQKIISLSKFSGYTQNDRPEVVYVSVEVRANDPTILDVTYRVKSSKPTVKVRALAFKDGIRSFDNVVRPVAFIEGTDANIGDSIAANQEHKLSWRVSTDWQIDLAKVKFEVLAVEEDLLPLELITIPANGTNRAMEISWNAISDAQVFDALLWLYADGDAGLTLTDGVLVNGSAFVARGTSVQTSTTSSYCISVNGQYYTMKSAPEYIFSKMGFSVLEGDTLTYAKGATRLNLSPSGGRQYAYRWIDAQ